jgi:Cu-Zn family superoxide dismutase
MRNRMTLVTALTVVAAALFAFGAFAQDATVEPTTDPNATVVPTTDPNATVVPTTDPNAPTATIEGTTMVAFGSANIRDMSGNGVGSVIFTTLNDGKVMVTANFVNMPPGIHGMHVHTVADCEVHTDHYNPTGASHPNHAGDLAALFVIGDGSAMMTAVTDRFTVADLMAGEGTKLNVHALPDNYAHIPGRYGPQTDPAAPTPDPAMPMDASMMGNAADALSLADGDSGEPIACGEIEEGFMAIVPNVTPTSDAGGAPGATSEATDELTATIDLTLSPDLSATVDPNVTVTIDPGLTETVDPGLTATVDPALTVTVDPGLTETVDPGVTATVDPAETPLATPETAVPVDPTASPPPA